MRIIFLAFLGLALLINISLQHSQGASIDRPSLRTAHTGDSDGDSKRPATYMYTTRGDVYYRWWWRSWWGRQQAGCCPRQGGYSPRPAAFDFRRHAVGIRSTLFIWYFVSVVGCRFSSTLFLARPSLFTSRKAMLSTMWRPRFNTSREVICLTPSQPLWVTGSTKMKIKPGLPSAVGPAAAVVTNADSRYVIFFPLFLQSPCSLQSSFMRVCESSLVW